MTTVGSDLIAWWFIHKAQLALLDETAVDPDNQPTGAYGDPITITNCRLHDATADQIIDAEQAGIQNITSVLLVPNSVIVPGPAKVYNTRLRQGDLSIDASIFTVEGQLTKRSVEGDEYRQLLLRRVS